MNDEDEIKRKMRKLKKLELKIRYNGIKQPGQNLVWDQFFDLQGTKANKAKYSLRMLTSMNREQYRTVVSEYFSSVYYELYKENGVTGTISGIFDPVILSKLGLPYNADENDIKRRFRELAKCYHPDAGGDAAMFIELMDHYKKLMEK